MNKNIIFIVNIKDPEKSTRVTPYQISINSWKNWAKNNNSEVFVLEDRIYPKEQMNPNWHKILVFDLLENENIDYQICFHLLIFQLHLEKKEQNLSLIF